MSKESSGVFSEPVSLPYASLPSVYLHLKHCWRLDGGCQIRRWIARKLGLVGTQRSCLFVPSALCHDQLYPSPSWQRDKHLSNLFQCFPCSLFCSPCSFFLILLLVSITDLFCYNFLCHGHRGQLFSFSLYSFHAWGFSFTPSLSSLFKLHSTTYFSFFFAGHVSDLWSFLLPSIRYSPMSPLKKAIPKLGSTHQLRSHQCWIQG